MNGFLRYFCTSDSQSCLMMEFPDPIFKRKPAIVTQSSSGWTGGYSTKWNIFPQTKEKTLFIPLGVAPEPDSTEDSFGPEPHRRSTSSPIRRCSHPVTGSPRDALEAATRRSSEGNARKITFNVCILSRVTKVPINIYGCSSKSS